MWLPFVIYGCRRDSFITHRAFCDALAQESARAITAVNIPLLHSHPLQAPPAPPLLLSKKEPDFIPPWMADHQAPTNQNTLIRPLISSSTSHLDQSLNLIHQNPNNNPNISTPSSLPRFQSPSSASPYMSATALLQKASQIGHMPQSDQQCTTMPNSSSSLPVSGFGMPSRDHIGLPHQYPLASYANKAAQDGFVSDHYLEDAPTTTTPPITTSLFHDMMATNNNGSSSANNAFEDALRGMLNPTRDATVSDEMTRDFLGLKAFSQKDFFNISGLDHLGSSSYGDKQGRNQTPWQG